MVLVAADISIPNSRGTMDPEDNSAIEVVQEFELTDDEQDDDFEYKSVGEEDLSDDDDSEDFQTARQTLEKSSVKRTKSQRDDDIPSGGDDVQVVTEVKPSAIDDFIRNFLLKMGMMGSLDKFNTEWYELQSKKLVNSDGSDEEVPDVYLQNQKLEMDLKLMREEVEKFKAIADKAQGTWNKFRKERNFHRTNHQRVVQEKKKLITDIKRLKEYYSHFEPTLATVKKQYESALKEKMLMKLERDRLRSQTKSLHATIDSLSGVKEGTSLANTSAKSSRAGRSTASTNAAARAAANRKGGKTKKEVKRTPMSAKEVINPYAELEFDRPSVENFALSKTFKGHSNAISGLAFHPKKPILATVSDDETWKLWASPNGDLIMSGEGHQDWLSDIAFHPNGTRLATCSGDATVKVWDFINAKCAATLAEHTKAVWAIDFHHSGNFLASASMDQTAKLWDLNTNKCVSTFRAHVDSINFTQFQPFSNLLCTVSGDKTISMWDARTGLIVSTLYGHNNAVNCGRFNIHGDTLATCDADGVVKLWDHRMVSELGSIDVGRHGANEIAFDRSGKVLAVASDDGTVKCLDVADRDNIRLVHTLSGHEGAVQSVLFDPQSRYLVSGGSDNSFRIWL